MIEELPYFIVKFMTPCLIASIAFFDTNLTELHGIANCDFAFPKVGSQTNLLFFQKLMSVG